MAFSTGGNTGPMVDMNVTPLVDVMLVLLIIFMITVPALPQRIMIDLPQKSTVTPPEPPPPPIELTINPSGQLFWNNRPMTQDMFELELSLEAKKETQAMLQIKADPATEYQILADVMGSAKNIGMNKIGFEMAAN